MRCLALAALSALVRAWLAQAPPAFPTDTQLVTIDAVVLDGDGRPVPGLTAGDFRVEEDGAAREIVRFEAFSIGAPAAPSGPLPPPSALSAGPRPLPPGARSFVLLVDDVGLAPSRQADVRRAVERFADEGLRDGDELRLSTTSGAIAWTARLPEGREDVRALAGRIRGRRLSESPSDFMSDWEAFRIARVESPIRAGLDSAGVPALPTGPPTGAADAGARVAAPGSSTMERVVVRWLERRVCDPLAVELCRSQVASRARALDQARANRTRDVLARVDQAVFALSSQKGRKALLLLSEGFLNDPDVDAFRLVSGRCREASIAVYFLDVQGLSAGYHELDAASQGGAPNAAELSLMRQEAVEFLAGGSVALAEDTGGAALRHTNDLGGAAVRAAQESRVYYLLGIAPPAGKGPRDWRRLRVTIDRPGLRVRARRGYTLRTSADIERDERERARRPSGGEEPVPPGVLRALASAAEYDDIPLRAMAFTSGPRPEGRVHTVVALEVGMDRVAKLGGEDHPATGLSLSVAVTHRDTGEVRRADQQVRIDTGEGGPALDGWLALRREFDLRPGVSQARVVVRDEFLGRTGAVTVRFEVPVPEGLRLSTPVLTDRTLVRSGQPPRPVLVARRAFGTRGTLYGQCEVLGARSARAGAPPVKAAYELRRRDDGVVVRRGLPAALAPDLQGRLLQAFSLPLDGLTRGEYELVLRAEDRAASATVERVEALRLE